MADEPTINGQDAASLFANINFTIVPSDKLNEQVARQLALLITNNGGVEVPLDADTGRVRLADASHIISSTSDFPDYHPAVEAFISVVKPEWITTSIARKRLVQIRQYNPDPRLFFSGVTVYCIDLPPGDMDAIHGGVVAMGGQYSESLTKLVTHIVALTDDTEKCRQAKTKGMRCKVVLPHWFDDCLKLGKRIDERAYTLPNPEIICARPGDPVPIPSDRHLAGASSQASRLPTPQGSSNPLRRDSKVFQGKKVLLSSDLNIGSRLRGTIEDLIVDGGGHVTGSIHKADMLVCQFRDSEDYRIASRAGKDVGNVPWLYFVITHNVWTSPMRCLLHYPIARQGLPGFRGCRISLSNYAGEARVYLENLIRAAGGEYTKTMNVDNTHLITARAQSEKCTAAREWNIHIVNHLWLEESYARWEIQSLSNPRYSHFPTRANLGEVVGQTEIDRDAVREFFFPAEEDSESVDSDRRALRGVPEADQNTTASFQTSNGISEVGPEGDEGATSSSPNASIGDLTPKSKKTGQSHNATRSINTPLATRFTGDDKENETPRTSGSRGAKARAMARLHDLAPDMALYEKEKKRVGGVVHGGRKAAEDVVRKRASASAGEGEVESDVDMEDERAVKRQKKTRRAPFMKLVLTSYKRWSSQPRTADTEKNQLRDLGIIIVDSPSDCTHLAAPSMIRTVKFISTLAFAPIIISTDFVDHCLSDDEVPPVKDFLLHDVETEKRLGFKLTEALERAKANKRGLLKGSKICCTPTIANGVDTFKSIVEANGGHCEVFRPRSGLTWDGGHEETGYEEKVVYLLSSESQEERKLHDKFIQAASEHDLEARVVKFDWLLDAALSQQVKWDKRYDLGSSRKA